MIDPKARDFIIRWEVTSPAYYEKHYRKPEWPGASSGITIGVGYDLGYATATKVHNDFGHLVSDEMLQIMCSCVGVKGTAARDLLPRVKDKIDIPWAAAIEVFDKRDIPQWIAAVQAELRNTDKLSPLCLGMLVSTAYNRGAGGFSITDDRHREMWDIRKKMAAEDFAGIGDDFRSMTRLWPAMKGLRDRYTETAALWEEGLKAEAVPIPPQERDPEIPTNAGPARTKPSTTTAAQNGTAGSIVLATHGAAQAAVQAGWPTHTVIAIAVCGVVVAATAWMLWYRNRNPY